MRKILCALLGMLLAGTSWSATLPAGYTELEYIDNNGTAWLDLGMPIGTSDIVTFDLEWNTLGSVPFFGGYNSGGSYNSQSFVGTYTGDGSAKGFYANSNGMFRFAATKDTRYLIKWNGCGVNPTVNGVDFSGIGTCTDFTPSVNAYLFTRNEGGNAGRIDDITLYGFKVERNGILIMDLVPAKRNADNVVGMYDTVSGTFFTNAGTGTFTGGPAVLDSCRNLFDSTPYKTGYYINESGVEQSANAEQYIIRQAVVQPGTQYTLSFVVTQANYTQRYHAYDANGNWLSQVAAVGGSEVVGTKVIKTFTTPANTKYIRQGGRSQSEYQLELGSTATAYVPFCANAIKIATTAYNSARFSPVVTELNDTIATIRSVVTNTINQTKAIADLQATKQTRPDETCPAGKKCLLVEDDAGQPHWYEIIENAD